MDDKILEYNLEVIIQSQYNSIARLQASNYEHPLQDTEPNPWKQQRLSYISTKIG